MLAGSGENARRTRAMASPMVSPSSVSCLMRESMATSSSLYSRYPESVRPGAMRL